MSSDLHVTERNEYERISRLGRDSPNEWIRKSSEIGGWIFDGEHEYLWDLATRANEGDILEIGTWMGKSACILAGACIEEAPDTSVICIDPFDLSGTEEQEGYHKRVHPGSGGTFYEFLDNARRLGFRDYVVPVATRSEVALRALRLELRLVFVDGAHDLPNMKKDVELSLPRLRVGGLLAIHDAHSPSWPGVQEFIDRQLSSEPSLREIGTVNTLVAFEKIL